MEGGPPTFRQGFSSPALLEDHDDAVPVRDCHPLWFIFPDNSGFVVVTIGLVRVRSPLLAESRLMSFPPGTEMFQFPGFARHGYGFTVPYRPKTVGCPIRKSADQRLLAPSRSLSQRATSFIASQCQGIHQMPLKRLNPRDTHARERSPPWMFRMISTRPPSGTNPLGPRGRDHPLALDYFFTMSKKKLVPDKPRAVPHDPIRDRWWRRTGSNR